MKKTLFYCLCVLLLQLLLTVPVFGGDPQTVSSETKIEELEREIESLKKKLEENRRMEERMEALEQKLEEVKKVTAQVEKQENIIEEKKGTPAFTFWKNDFYLETPDGNFSMRIRGNIHLDTKFYGGNSENPTEIDIRRARIDFQGLWYKYIQFRVQAEFADSPYIRNAWVDYKFREWLHLRAGQMKPPFSTSWWTLDNRVNFLERGSSTPVYPYFDRGFWVWGDVLDNTLTWNASIFTGAGMELDAPKGDIDDHKDIIVRIFYSPFKNSTGHVLEGLHLCLQGTYSDQSIPTERFENKGMSTQIRDDKMWKWRTESSYSRGEIGQRNRWGVEAHYIRGPISFSTEYLVVQYKDVEVYDRNTGTKVISVDGDINSWSTWVSYFLTGESKSVSNFGWRQPNPRVNFDPVKFKGTGAWEILARYTHTDASEDFFDRTTFGENTFRVMDGASWTDEYTVGAAWTWNPLVRWQLNYTHITAGGPQGIFSGDSNNLEGQGNTQNEDMVGMRMIFKF